MDALPSQRDSLPSCPSCDPLFNPVPGLFVSVHFDRVYWKCPACGWVWSTTRDDGFHPPPAAETAPT